MSNIDSSMRAPFFPNKNGSKGVGGNTTSSRVKNLGRNSYERSQQINNSTKHDARVDINDKVKDFSRIKKAVDAAPSVDNSDKIARLRSQIQAGTYEVDYDGLADKILSSEF